MSQAKSPPIGKPWSTRKRVMMAGLISLMILMVAIIAGSMMYFMGVKLNLFQPFSLEEAVTDEIVNNDELVQDFYQKLQEKSCINTKYRYGVSYDHPLLITPTSDEEAVCSEYRVTTSQGKTALVKIQIKPTANDVIVREIIEGMTYAESNIFNHPEYESILVWGSQDEQEVMYIILTLENNKASIISYYPADPIGMTAAKDLARSFEMVD